MSAWLWILHSADGAELRSTSSFESKEEAEAWMGEHWSELLEEGAESVSLMSGDERSYQMSLRAT
jgi:hypothetical protein